MNNIFFILVFVIGFFCGIGVLISIRFFLPKINNKQNESESEIVSLKQHMESIQLSLQNFNLAQNRLENTLVRGGSQQQGSWGEFVLKNILDGAGLREGHEYETQKAFTDEYGNLQKPDVIVRMPGNRDIVIDSKVPLSAWHDFSNSNDAVGERLTIIKGNTVIMIINLIRCAVATWDKSDFSYSAKIIKGPNAPGAEENIDVFSL